jgi:hypothetical protein
VERRCSAATKDFPCFMGAYLDSKDKAERRAILAALRRHGINCEPTARGLSCSKPGGSWNMTMWRAPAKSGQ